MIVGFVGKESFFFFFFVLDANVGWKNINKCLFSSFPIFDVWLSCCSCKYK